jgi:hypothetical protein
MPRAVTSALKLNIYAEDTQENEKAPGIPRGFGFSPIYF